MSGRRDAGTEDVGRAIRAVSATVAAPASLRIAVARRPARGRPAWATALAAAAAACVAAAVLALAPVAGTPPGAGAGVADAARAALRPPAAPAPRAADGSLALSAGGVRFPEYGAGSAWRAVGTRRDRLGGRTAVSVAYAAGGARAGYAIVDGAPLPVPRDARSVVYEGLHAAVLERDGMRIVTWRRGGRTCVVAARATSLERLLELAAQT